MANSDPFRPADNWSECPDCGDSIGWNNEDGLEGQECSNCGHIFEDGDEAEAAPWIEPRVTPSPRSRPSCLAERTLEGARC